MPLSQFQYCQIIFLEGFAISLLGLGVVRGDALAAMPASCCRIFDNCSCLLRDITGFTEQKHNHTGIATFSFTT